MSKQFTHRLSRLCYSGLWCAGLPILLGRLGWRSTKNRRQLMRLHERFGYVAEQMEAPLWIHAASVGEVMAIVPLVKALKKAHPSTSIIVSTVTLTGADRVAEQLAGVASHIFLPYDLPWFVSKALSTIKPRCLVLVETEIWPNLIAQANKRDVPVVLVNARMSEKSAKGYEKISSLITPALAQLRAVYAQFDADGQRLVKLGLPSDNLEVTGSIKFDVMIDPAQSARLASLRESWGEDRPVWMVASTHEGEEKIALEMFTRLKQKHPNLLLVIAPRHPERFDMVAKLIDSHGLTLARRSEQLIHAQGHAESSLNAIDVYLSDTLGELAALYACADAVMIGGSFNPVGGHNPLEPAYHAVAPVTGPHVHNFSTVFNEMAARGGAFISKDEQQAEQQAARLLGDLAVRSTAGQAAKDYVDAHTGVLDKIVERLSVYM